MREVTLAKEADVRLAHLEIAPGRGAYKIYVGGREQSWIEYFAEEEKLEKKAEARKQFEAYCATPAH